MVNRSNAMLTFAQTPKASPGRGRLYQVKADLRSVRASECQNVNIAQFNSGMFPVSFKKATPS